MAVTISEVQTDKIYSSQVKVRTRDIAYTPGLGYTPILVIERRVLSENILRRIKGLLGAEKVRSIINVMAPDPDYVELLKRAGFEIDTENNSPFAAPLIRRIYGGIKGRFRIHEPSFFITFYPPLGYYDVKRKSVFILQSVADKLGVIVHENVHYIIDVMKLKVLREIEEPVARFYEIIAELNCPTIPLLELEKKLRDENVVREMSKLLEKLGVDDLYARKHWFINIINAVEECMLDPCVIANMIRGETCIEDHGLVYRFVPCSRK